MSSTSSTSPADEPLDPRDEQVAALLAAGKTEVEVAAELGCARSTVQRCVAKPATRALMRGIRLTAAAAALNLLLSESRDAAQRLIELSKTGERGDTVKLRACVAIIELAHRGVELVDLGAELEDLRSTL